MFCHNLSCCCRRGPEGKRTGKKTAPLHATFPDCKCRAAALIAKVLGNA